MMILDLIPVPRLMELWCYENENVYLYGLYYTFRWKKTKKNYVALVRKRTIPTDQPPLDEVSVKICR
jgi:hypothetical protein